MEGLAANKSYNITILSTTIDNKTLPNMHYIHLEKTNAAVFSGEEAVDLMEMAKEEPATKAISDIYNFYLLTCQGLLVLPEFFLFFSYINFPASYDSEGFQTLLNYPDDFKFDLILTDFALGPCLLPFLHKFKYPPLIGFTAFNAPSNKIKLVGGHFYPAYGKFDKIKFDKFSFFF